MLLRLFIFLLFDQHAAQIVKKSKIARLKLARVFVAVQSAAREFVTQKNVAEIEPGRGVGLIDLQCFLGVFLSAELKSMR